MMKYELLKKYRAGVGYVYRGLKKVVRFQSYYLTYLGCIMEALKMKSMIKEAKVVPGKKVMARYKTKWSALSVGIPSVFMDVYPAISGVDSSDYVPDSLYFTHIEPMLNNREYSRSFDDKNMYSILFDKEIQPQIFLRKIHGTYYSPDYTPVSKVDDVLHELAEQNQRCIIKKAVESQGGRSIALLKKQDGCLRFQNQEVSKEWLDVNYNDNFLLQEVVEQHPFYSAFNSSSLNTLRVFTYRSVADESVHVLHTVLRVGAPGAVVDNISSGGKACAVKPDGTLNTEVVDYYGHISSQLGEVMLKPGTPLYKFDEINVLATKLAEQQLYSRVIGFDFCVDKTGKVMLIELNNFDIGVNGLQILFGPLFGRFTDEVLEYCLDKKRRFRYPIF